MEQKEYFLARLNEYQKLEESSKRILFPKFSIFGLPDNLDQLNVVSRFVFRITAYSSFRWLLSVILAVIFTLVILREHRNGAFLYFQLTNPQSLDIIYLLVILVWAFIWYWRWFEFCIDNRLGKFRYYLLFIIPIFLTACIYSLGFNGEGIIWWFILFIHPSMVIFVYVALDIFVTVLLVFLKFLRPFIPVDRAVTEAFLKEKTSIIGQEKFLYEATIKELKIFQKRAQQRRQSVNNSNMPYLGFILTGVALILTFIFGVSALGDMFRNIWNQVALQWINVEIGQIVIGICVGFVTFVIGSFFYVVSDTFQASKAQDLILEVLSLLIHQKEHEAEQTLVPLTSAPFSLNSRNTQESRTQTPALIHSKQLAYLITGIVAIVTIPFGYLIMREK